MSKVWRRLQRVGKKASKFRYSAYSFNLVIDSNSKWQPDKVCVTLSHRERKISSKFGQWEPGLADVYKGAVLWEKTSDLVEFDVTLYRGINDGGEFEPKEWILMIESEDSHSKRRLLATGKMNVEMYASMDPLQEQVVEDFKLKIVSNKIKSIKLDFSISSEFIKDGKATDEDMISIASYMSIASGNPARLSNRKLANKMSSSDITTDKTVSSNSSPAKLLELSLADDPDTIDYYLKLKLKQDSDISLNSISQNFQNSSQLADKSTLTLAKENMVEMKKNDFQESFLAELKQNSANKMAPAIKTDIPSQISSTDTIKPNNAPSNPFKGLDANPFVENDTIMINESINPFLDPQESMLLNSPPQHESTKHERAPLHQDNNNNHKNEILNASNTTKDLLEWCKDICCQKSKTYSPLFKNLTMNDFSSSWINGLAFCAILYHFKSDLIDLSKLSATNSKSNLKLAFNASDSEAIVRVVDVADLLNTKSPDQLSIMTYLFNICDHFEPKYSKRISKNTTAPATANSKTLKLLMPTFKIPSLMNNNNKKKLAPILPQETTQTIDNKSYFNPFEDDDDGDVRIVVSPAPSSQTASSSGLIRIEPNGEIINVNPSEFDSSPSRRPSAQVKLVQRKNSSLNNSSSSSSSSSLNSSSNPSAVSSKVNSKAPNQAVVISKDLNSQDLIQKARELMEKNKKSMDHQSVEESEVLKKEKIKQRAKQMIAESKKLNLPPRKNSVASSPSSCTDTTASTVVEEAVDANLIGTEYVNSEILNLKSKQNELDEQGNSLETQLRRLMADTDRKKTEHEKELEDILLRKWFLLVNEKNALLHQQQELEILQNEKNLEKRHDILTNQLRYLMSIDDWKKTDEQKKTESILFNELICTVNKRNELVTQLDEENKLLTEGEILNKFIQNKSSFQQEKENACSIQ
jgi:hypothetical protein